MFKPRLTGDGMLESLGLGGDGDEVGAIHDVERCFGVKLDYSAAGGWRTVGDVYTALDSALPHELRDAPDNWTRLARSIAGQIGVDPTSVSPKTLLLSTGGRPWIILTAIAIAIAIAIVAVVAATLLR